MGYGYSIFRRTQRGQPDRRYTIEIRRPDGTRFRRAGFTDRAATKARAAEMVRELERREVGLFDVHAEHRRLPLRQHLEVFLVAMAAGSLGRRRPGGQVSEEHIARVRGRLQRLFDELVVTRVEHLAVEPAEALLVKWVADGMSAKTRDDHAALLRQFGAWLVSAGRWSANPFARLRNIRSEATVTFRRAALTVAELDRLVEAAEVRPVVEYRRIVPMARPETMARIQQRGREQGLLYVLAAYTGLRRGEITALQWGDLRGGDTPAIELRAETTKNRRRARVELPTWLAQMLDDLRAERGRITGAPPSPRSLVFAGSGYSHLTDRLKKDALFAGLGRVGAGGKVTNDAGLVVDFHALRGSLATLAAEAGMPAKLLQQHMRHSDIRLTMQTYAQARDAAMRAELDRLPRPATAPESAGSLPADASDCRALPTGQNREETGT